MLILFFYIGNEMYAMKCDNVREIAPMVRLKEVPHSPEFFAGHFNYRGTIVPVVDLRRLIEGEACRIRLSTRIILVDYRPEGRKTYILGILAEKVTEAKRKAKKEFIPPNIRSEKAPYLGGIVMEEGEMIPYIDLDYLPNCINYLPADEDDGPVDDE